MQAVKRCLANVTAAYVFSVTCVCPRQCLLAGPRWQDSNAKTDFEKQTLDLSTQIKKQLKLIQQACKTQAVCVETVSKRCLDAHFGGCCTALIEQCFYFLASSH